MYRKKPEVRDWTAETLSNSFKALRVTASACHFSQIPVGALLHGDLGSVRSLGVWPAPRSLRLKEALRMKSPR